MDENEFTTTQEQNIPEQNVPEQNAAPQGQPYYQEPQMNQNQQCDPNTGYGQQPQFNQSTGYAQNQQYSNNGQQQYNQNPYGQPQQFNQNPYNQQFYQNPPVYMNQNGYAYQQPQRGIVKDVFCYILYVLEPLAIIAAIFLVNEMFQTMESTMLYSSYYGSYYGTSIFSPAYWIGMIVSMILGIAILIFLILDIVQVHKQGYPITGLILFAIFFRLGYYVWRAHILNKKMTVPIIYTVCLSCVTVGTFIWYMVEMCNFISTIMMYAM